MSKTTLVAIAFLAGCGAAVVAPLVIPPAHAQVTQRWETHCHEVWGYHDRAVNVARVGQAAGQEGWELASVTNMGSLNLVCFKRPAP